MIVGVTEDFRGESASALPDIPEQESSAANLEALLSQIWGRHSDFEVCGMLDLRMLNPAMPSAATDIARISLLHEPGLIAITTPNTADLGHIYMPVTTPRRRTAALRYDLSPANLASTPRDHSLNTLETYARRISVAARWMLVGSDTKLLESQPVFPVRRTEIEDLSDWLRDAIPIKRPHPV